MAGGTAGFRREPNIWEAVGFSVGLMAPSMAANINPRGVTGSVGRAVPLTFAPATVGVLSGERLTADQGLAPTREPA